MQNKSIDTSEVKFFERIQSLVNSEPVVLSKSLTRICAVDAAYSDKDRKVVAAAALYDNGVLSETSVYSGRFTFPYHTGLFFLHEGPFVVAAVNKLKVKPQLACFDAQGLAHPRSKGLATICGMVLEIPSIGIAKTALIGKALQYKDGLGKLNYKGRHVGFITLDSAKKKLFWSPGYSISLEQLERTIALHQEICLNASREAHRLSKIEILRVKTKPNLQ